MHRAARQHWSGTLSDPEGRPLSSTLLVKLLIPVDPFALAFKHKLLLSGRTQQEVLSALEVACAWHYQVPTARPPALRDGMLWTLVLPALWASCGAQGEWGPGLGLREG